MALIGSAGTAVRPARAVLVYSDNFSTAGGLNGAAPTTTSGSNGGTAGATWTAAAGWSKSAGSATISAAGNNNAFLPFTPQTGKIYTLSISENIPAPANTNFMALGFTNSNATTTNFRTTLNAAAWMNQRRAAGADTIAGFLGPNTTNPGGSVVSSPGLHTMQVNLDTTGTLWTVQWFADGVSIGSATYAVNPTITQVGFGQGNGATGSVSAFSLTAVTPEPSTWAMMGLGLVMLSYVRRRRQQREQEPQVAAIEA